MSLLRRAWPLRSGERLQLDGRLCVFAGGFDADGGVAGLRLEDALTRAPASLTADEFETAYAAGRVRITRAQGAVTRAPAAVPPEGEDAPARRRLWCEFYDAGACSKSDAALRTFVAETALRRGGEGAAPSLGALRGWLRERGVPGARRSADMADRRTFIAPIRMEPLAQRVLAEEADRFFDGVRLNPQAVCFATRPAWPS